MHVAENTFKMNNFSEECADEKKLVHTELSMQPGEFEAYTIGQPTSLTFCLKVAWSPHLLSFLLNSLTP